MQIRDSDEEEDKGGDGDGDGDGDGETEDTADRDEDSTERIVGDSIGDTAYSQRFVIKCLMGLATAAKVTTEFLDQELCLIWDMATDRHVVLFLADHGTVSLLVQALARATVSDEDEDRDEETARRLAEILIGILTNMCCFPEGMRTVTAEPDNVDLILENVQSDDSRILLQTFRFIFNCVYYDGEHLSAWLDHLSGCRFADAAAFVLCNSTNRELLEQTFETINCLCSARESRPDDERFSELFKNRNIIEHSVTGLGEIQGLSGEDEVSYERIEILFLSIHSTLYKVLSDCDDRQYMDSVSLLFKTMNEILQRNVREETENLEDMICYLLKIFTSDCPPACSEIDALFNIILSRIKNNVKSSPSEFEDDTSETVDSSIELLLAVMASVNNDRFFFFKKEINDEVRKVIVNKLKSVSEQTIAKYKNIINILHSDS